MTSELQALGLYGLLVLVSILAQVLAATAQVGILPLVGNREDLGKLPGLAGRLDRMQMNSVIALALVAPAVLILQARGAFTPSTLLAAQLFLGCRLVYALVYAAGLPWIRTLSWLGGFLATAWLYLAGL